MEKTIQQKHGHLIVALLLDGFSCIMKKLRADLFQHRKVYEEIAALAQDR
jgi:hypothetical protein